MIKNLWKFIVNLFTRKEEVNHNDNENTDDNIEHNTEITMKKLVVILDPAHGIETPGKRSPDGEHREYRWSRERLKELEVLLKENDYRVEYTATGENEPGLSVRKNHASSLIVEPGQVKLMISLHNNAAGSGSEWLNATGVEIFTTVGKTKSDEYAEIVYKQLQKDFPNLKYRGLKESNFTVLTGSGYYAMLIEWLFQDSKQDVALLGDSKTNKELVDSLYKALETINSSL